MSQQRDPEIRNASRLQRLEDARDGSSSRAATGMQPLIWAEFGLVAPHNQFGLSRVFYMSTFSRKWG